MAGCWQRLSVGLVGQHIGYVLQEDAAYGLEFAQSSHQYADGVAFLLQRVFPCSGNVFLGVVAAYQKQGDEGDFPGLAFLQLMGCSCQVGVSFDGADVDVVLPSAFSM